MKMRLHNLNHLQENQFAKIWMHVGMVTIRRRENVKITWQY